MVFLDTNIFMYVGNGTLSRLAIDKLNIAHASVVRIESLGFHQIGALQERILKEILSISVEYSLTDSIIERAIQLRQAKRLSLGNAIIAATALENDCALWTANTEDFADIENLQLHNPLAGI